MQKNARTAEERIDLQAAIEEHTRAGELETQLTEAIDALERVPWRQVDTVSSETAAVFASRLIEQRDRRREGL